MPHPGKPVTVMFAGEIPSNCGGFSVGIRKVEPAFPLNVTTNQQIVYPKEDACRQPPRPPCQFELTLTLNAEPFCECRNMRALIKGGINVSDPDLQGRAHLKMTLQWFMGCAAGRVGECKGEIRVVPPSGTDILLRAPPNGRITCNGKCNRTGGAPTTADGGFLLQFTSKRSLLTQNRANKRSRFLLKAKCLGGLPGEPARQVATIPITIAFGPGGFSDRKRSDLNGDGKPP